MNGYVKPGTLLAVMGASGAGKTSFMTALAGKTVDQALLDGEIAVNGKICDSHTMSNISGFVHQVDMFFGSLTVKEHLLYTVSNLVCDEYRCYGKMTPSASDPSGAPPTDRRLFTDEDLNTWKTRSTAKMEEAKEMRF